MWVKSLLLSAFVAAGAVSAPVDASPRAPQLMQQNWLSIQDRRDQRQQNIRPLREVVDQLRAQYGGDLISARLEEYGRPVYVLRWRMPDGQVRDFRVDAAR